MVSDLKLSTLIFSKNCAGEHFVLADFFLLHLFTPYNRLFAPTSQSPWGQVMEINEEEKNLWRILPY